MESLLESTLESATPNVDTTERWASLFAGSLLVAYGIIRSKWGLMMAGVGGALVYRGITGHCDVYEKLGINTVRGESPFSGLRQDSGTVEHNGQGSKDPSPDKAPAAF